jgi:hypothetical protein
VRSFTHIRSMGEQASAHLRHTMRDTASDALDSEVSCFFDIRVYDCVDGLCA